MVVNALHSRQGPSLELLSYVIASGFRSRALFSPPLPLDTFRQHGLPLQWDGHAEGMNHVLVAGGNATGPQELEVEEGSVCEQNW